MHCLDRINCDALLTPNDITNIQAGDVADMRNEYLEATLTDFTTKGLGEVTIPKLTATKWLEFKTALIESLSRIIGKNKIPLSYLVRETRQMILPLLTRIECSDSSPVRYTGVPLSPTIMETSSP